MRHNSLVIDSKHCLIHFPHLTVKVKSATLGTRMSSKTQIVFSYGDLTVLPMTTNTLTAFVDHPSEWQTTGPVTPLVNGEIL